MHVRSYDELETVLKNDIACNFLTTFDYFLETRQNFQISLKSGIGHTFRQYWAKNLDPYLFWLGHSYGKLDHILINYCLYNFSTISQKL